MPPTSPIDVTGGGIFQGIHAPLCLGPCRIHSLHGPICSHLFLTCTGLGDRCEGGLSGDSLREYKKDSRPQAVEWAGVGKQDGGRRFCGPVGPITYSSMSTLLLHDSQC